MFFELRDGREVVDFSGRTFSGCHKTESEKDLSAALSRGDIETAVYRSADLLCAGHVLSVWEVMADFFCRFIGTRNHKAIVLMGRKHARVLEIMGSIHFPIDLRNSEVARKAIAEMCVVLCLSPRQAALPSTSIYAASEFRIDVLSQRVAATSETFIYTVLDKFDSPDIHIPINELGFSLDAATRDFGAASYWIEWIVEYDHHCRQRKEKCTCSERKDILALLPSSIVLTPSSRAHIVWVVWQLVLIECEKRETAAFFHAVAVAAMQLFAHKFTAAAPRKRKGLLLFVAAMLCEPSAPEKYSVLAPEHRPVARAVLDNLNNTYEALGAHVSTATVVVPTNIGFI